MNAQLLGFFSGFPTHHFTDRIAEVLKEELNVRDSLVFISCQPENSAQNDEEAEGMQRCNFGSCAPPSSNRSLRSPRTVRWARAQAP